MLKTARGLTRELESTFGDVARRNRRIPAMERLADLVHAGRPSLPLFSYLACGLTLRSRDDDLHMTERRSAARFDLFLVVCLLGFATLIGAALHKVGTTFL